MILRCQDGYASSLPLADLLADTVLLADRLNGEPLSIEHEGDGDGYYVGLADGTLLRARVAADQP